MPEITNLPRDIQPDDVLPDDEQPTCGESVPIDGRVVECRLQAHREPKLHLGLKGTPDGLPFPWETVR